MTDDTINVDLIADLTQPVKGVNGLVNALVDSLNKLDTFEKRLDRMFSKEGPLSRNVAAINNQIEALAGISDKALRIAIPQFASGGPRTAVTNALNRGFAAQERTDPARQQLDREKEVNKTLAAREEIYRRLASKSTASSGENNAAYVASRRIDGDRREGIEILNEARSFNAKRYSEAQTAATKLVEIEAAKNAKIATANAAANAAELKRLERKNEALAAQNNKSIANAQYKDASVYDAQRRANEAENRRQAALAARPGPLTNEQIAVRTLGIQRARQTAGGGLPFLQTQLGSLANFAAIGAAIGGITAAGRAVIDFQTKMAELQAVSRATDPELKKVSEAILEVGTNSKFSLKDLSDAAITMAQAGFAAGDIAKALPSVNNLAAATGSSLADSAALTTSILSIYQLSIERTADVVNTLTAAANSSKLTLGQVSTAVQYSGAIAAQTGVKFDELITSFAAMAQAGAKSGNLLGTGTRQLISDLANPTAKFQKELAHLGLTVDDVNIRTQGYAGALKNLKDAGFTAEAALKSLDRRAATAYALNYNGIDGFAQFQAKITGTNAAGDAAATQMKTLQAQTTRLGNAITEFLSTAGAPFIATLTGMISGLAGVTHAAAGVSIPLAILGTLVASFAASSLLVWLGNLAKTLIVNSSLLKIFNLDLIEAALLEGDLGLAAGTAAAGIQELSLAMLANPVVLLTAGIAAMVGVLFGVQIATNLAKAEVDKYTAALNEATQKVADHTGKVAELDAQIVTLSDRHARLATHTDEVTAATAIASRAFAGFGGVLDGVGGNVDTLISKLLKLKDVQLQSIVLAQQARLIASDTALDKSRGVLGGQLLDARFTAGRAISNLTGSDRRTLGPDGLAALTALQSGTLPRNSAAFNHAITVLQSVKSRLPAGSYGQSQVQGVINALGPAASTVLDIGTRETENAGIKTDLATSQLAASPAAQALNAQVIAARNRNQDLYRAAVANKDPKASLAALAQVQADAQASRTAIEAKAAAIPGGAGLLTDNPLYHDLQDRSGGSNGRQSDGSLKSQLTLANAQYRRAKAAHDVAGIKKYGAVIGGIKDQQIIAAAAAQSPEEGLASEGNQNQTDDVNTQTAVDAANRANGRAGRHAANQTSKNEAATFKNTKEDLKLQITALEGNTGPSNLAANLPALKTLLGAYSDAGHSEINATSDPANGGAAALAAQLKKFDHDTAIYVAKVLHTTIADATDLLAEQAKEAAVNQTGALQNQLRTGAGSLPDAIQKTTAAYNHAMDLELTALFEKKLAAGDNPLLNSKAQEDAAKVRQKYAKETIDGIIGNIDAALAGDLLRQKSEKYQFEAGLSAERRQLRLGNSALGQRTIGDTHRALNDIEDRPRQIRSSQFDLDQLVAGRASQQTGLDTLRGQRLNATGSEANHLDGEIEKTSAALAVMDNNIRLAKEHYDELVNKGQQFTTVSQAIAAAWKVFADQNQKGPLETFGDGLVGVFDNAHKSFQNLFTSVLSGTASMGQAFKAFGVSVLSSLLDLAAKIIANQILTMVLHFAASTFGISLPGFGGGGGGGTSISYGSSEVGGGGISFGGFRQGGYVRRAQGGASPFRDSQLTKTMPGEFIMQKSAVESIGVNTLTQMNATGNVHASAVSHAANDNRKPRDPDMVNVYVMAPNQQPQLGKKDVVAAISDDIYRNGQIKQLIKSVAVGAV